MAGTDYKSGLPIRSEADGDDEKVIVKIVDGQAGGTNQMKVDSDSNAQVKVHGTDPAAADQILRVSELGAITPDGVYDGTNNSEPGNVGIIAHTRATTPAKANQTFRPTGIAGTVLDTVHALDVALHDESGNAYSESNPLPVAIQDTEGTQVNDYNESTAEVVAGGSDSHTYTAGAAFKFTQYNLCAAVRAKFVVEFDKTGSGGFVKAFTKFVSTANNNVDCILKEPIDIDNGGKVKITRYNRDNQQTTLYSTISGHTVV